MRGRKMTIDDRGNPNPPSLEGKESENEKDDPACQTGVWNIRWTKDTAKVTCEEMQKEDKPVTDTQQRILDSARNEGDRVSLFDIQPNRDFDDPNKCADFIMDQLYDGPRHPDDGPSRSGEWVVAILGTSGLFFPYREVHAMEEGYSYFRITWNYHGRRILEGEA